MPCSDCGSTLWIKEDKKLFCPECAGLERADRDKLETEAEEALEKINSESLSELFDEFESGNVLMNVISYMNFLSTGLFAENYEDHGVEFDKLTYLLVILRELLTKENSGSRTLSNSPDEEHERIETALDGFWKLRKRAKDVKQGHRSCVKTNESSEGWKNFFANNRFFETEYSLEYKRCTESLVAGELDKRQEFAEVCDKFRKFDRSEDDSTPEKFGDKWGMLITQLKFVFSIDEEICDAYYTDFPDCLKITQIKELQEKLDGYFTKQAHQGMKEKGHVGTISKSDFDEAGSEIFGSNWKEVREYIVMSKDNLEAHPFFLEVEGKVEIKKPNWRKAKTVEAEQILYPRYLSKLLRFQSFPMMKNEDHPTGKEILDNVQDRRGEAFENNICRVLRQEGFDAYLNPAISRNEMEYDVLAFKDDEAYLIEAKYLLPKLNIGNRDVELGGTDFIDIVFNDKIFKEGDTDRYDKPHKGPSFTKQISEWEKLSPRDSFIHKSLEGENKESSLPNNWNEINKKKLVISNLVPSYQNKKGVKFLTDYEFAQYLAGEDQKLPQILSKDAINQEELV